MTLPICRCITCGRPESLAPGKTCPQCGPVFGIMEIEWELKPGCVPDFGKPGSGIFRFAPLLPVPTTSPFPLHVGDTPTYDCPRLAKVLGVEKCLVKDDGRNPSASLKDRASALAVAHALSLGKTTLAAASTGNAASSLALLSAATGLRAVLFVPKDAPRPKIAQMLLAGAVVVAVNGSYDQAFELCAKACERFGWYSRNTATNPVLAEGKKTVAFEIAEFCDWEPLDYVAIGVGDGCVFASIYQGFKQLFDLGLITRIPRLVGVQAQGCAPLARAFEKALGFAEPEENPKTYADSIAVGQPRDQVRALRAARDSGGMILAVPDALIRKAQRLLAQEAGVFAEPAGAAGFAGLMQLSSQGLLPSTAKVAAVVSGHALKDVDGAMSAIVTEPLEVGAGADAIADIERLVLPLINEG